MKGNIKKAVKGDERENELEMICGSKNCAFSIDGLFALYDLHFARLIVS